MNKKITVIIPVYNVEKYLSECLESIINQTLKDIEIICVNDCSSDNSSVILDQYKQKDDRIIIINHKNNLGLGEARNSGIKISIGEYISFIDSDDFIEYDFLEQLYNTAKKYNADIASTLNILAVYNDRTEKYNYNKIYEWKKDNNLMEGKSSVSIQNMMYETNEFTNVMSWNKIWKKDFLNCNHLDFQLKDRGEDIDLFYRALLHDPIIAFNHNAVYYYRQHDSSIVAARGEDFKFIVQTIKCIDNNIRYYKKYNLSKLPYLMREIIYNIIYEIENYNNKQEAFKYVHDYFLTLDFKRENFVYLNEYILFYIIRNFDDYNFFNLLKMKNDNINSELNLLKLQNSYLNAEIENLKNETTKLTNLHNKLIKKLCSLIPIKKLQDNFIKHFTD